MTQPKMSSSPCFVDFGYEPGTLVLGGMWFNTCVYMVGSLDRRSMSKEELAYSDN
ncbi:hypothetical protein IQ244_04890 [Nostoc sp. LEGE 06077]|uniref:hypothetical protein n=1 Tax=Nostoc sp. LEGE 06077 TaxID=915325 RepID=UPI00188026B4|nr:hypothetical protein [Nostoc sp. LEGE 06077]MBE9205859.1 hypothetical protein [Nostoc sp. LEGE 06077]